MPCRALAVALIAIVVANRGFGQDGEVPGPLVQTGHVWPLSFKAFANNGKLLVTESAHGIIIWDAATGEQLRNINTAAAGCQLSPDARTLLYVAKGGPFGTICLQPVQKSQPDVRIEIPKGCDTRSIRFSQDGSYLVARNNLESRLHVWRTSSDRARETAATGAAMAVPKFDDAQVTALQMQFEGSKRHEIPQGSHDVFRMLLAWQSAGTNGASLALAGSAPFDFGNGFFSPNGKLLVSVNWHDTGSSTEDVAIWNSNTGKLLQYFQAPYDSAQHVLFHPDGEHYLTGIGSRSAELHSTTSGEKVRTLGEFNSIIRSLAITPSGKWGIAGTTSGELAVWDAASGEQTAKTQLDKRDKEGEDKHFLSSIACVNDRKIVVAGGFTQIYSIPDLDLVQKIEQPADQVLVGPKRTRMLLSHSPRPSSQGAQVTLHDVSTGAKIKSIMRTPPTRLLLSPNGQWALGIPRREQFNEPFPSIDVPLWNIKTESKIHSFPPDSHQFDYHFPLSDAYKRDIVTTPPISSAGAEAIRPGRSRGTPDFVFRPQALSDFPPRLDSSALEWLTSLQSHASIPKLDGPQLMYRNGRQLRPTVWNTGLGNRTIAQYRNGVFSHEYVLPQMVPTSATLNAGGAQLIAGFRMAKHDLATKAIAIFSTVDGKLLKRIDATQKDLEASWDIDSLALSPDEQFLAVGFDYHNYILERKTDELTLVGKANGGLPARDIVLFSPDSQRAIVFGVRRTLWDLPAKKPLLDLGAYNDAHSMTFSPNGKTLFINGSDGPRLLDSSTGEVIHTFQRQIEVRFSPDGTRMMPLQYGAEVMSLWDFQKPARVCPLHEGLSRHLRDAMFTPDGKRIVCMETNDHRKSTLTVRDAVNGKVLGRHARDHSPFGHRGNHTKPLFVTNDRLITVQPNSVTVWEIPTAQPLHHFDADADHCSMIYRQGAVLVISPGEKATLWDIDSGKRLNDFSAVPLDLSHPNPVWFSDDGKTLFAQHRKGQSVTRWDVESGELIARHHLIDEGQTLVAEPERSLGRAR